MKKILVLFFGILVSMTMYSQEQNVHILRVEFNNGVRIAYVLSEKPLVTMPGESVRIYVEGPNMIDEYFKRSDVKRFYFEYVSSDDKDIYSNIKMSDPERVLFEYLDGENVRIIGLKDKTTVSVASLDGKIISTQKSDSAGSLIISLGNHPKGIYIISFEGRSIKVRR